MTKIKERIKKYAFLAGFATMTLSLSSCGETKTDTATTSVSTEATTNTSTEVPTKEVVAEATTEKVDTGIDSLNINDNASIEQAVDNTYEKYREFYKNNAMGKDEIRDIIFVINDKYTDEDGKLVIDEDRAIDAYMNIKKILFSSAMKQKLDNINIKDVKVENNFKIEEHPTLIDFVDQDLAGGELIADEIKEYEALRNSQIKQLNDTESYNREEVKAYVIKNEVTDIDNHSNDISNFGKNGHKFVCAAVHEAALNMAAIEFPEDDVIEVDYDGTVRPTIKINPTIGERDLEASVLRLRLEGLISDEEYNDVVSYVRSEVEVMDDKEELEKKIVEKWDIELDDANLLIAYAKYLNSMAITRHYDYECDEQNETVKDIQVKRSNTSSLNNVNELIYTL